MTLPTYKIEIAFNAGVTTAAASRTWTDVTSYVLLDSGIEITYGRGDWRSTADANTLKLTLNNSDGRFTAGRTASPYYPNVKIGRPIRVTATVGGVSSVRFLGFIDEWPLDWPASVGTFATTEITASSRLAWLADGMELRPIVEEEILNDAPSAYYTMGESVGASIPGDSSTAPWGSNRVAVSGTGAAPVFGAAGGRTADASTSVQFSGGKVFRFSIYEPTGGANGAMLSCFVSTTATPAATMKFLQFTSTFWIGMDTSGRLTGNTESGSLGTGPVINDGAAHHIAIAGGGGGGGVLYLDGVAVATGSGSISPGNASSGFVGDQLACTISHVAIFHSSPSVGPSALPTAARVAIHAAAGLRGISGDTPSSRITRYASYADIPATELSLDTGQVPALAHLDTTGSTAVEMMRKIEATEEGIIFDRADGALAFHDRAHRYSAASSFTLDVNQGQVGSGLQPRLDRTTLRNNVTAASTDGTITAHIVNATSVGTYGPARESLDLATTNADEPFEHASWLVNQYSDPQPRVPQLTVDLAATGVGTTLSQAILAAGVSTQFTVTGIPSQAAATSQDYIAEGYSESIGNARHSITFNISQAAPFDVFTIGDPVFGQYDAYPIAF